MQSLFEDHFQLGYGIDLFREIDAHGMDFIGFSNAIRCLRAPDTQEQCDLIRKVFVVILLAPAFRQSSSTVTRLDPKSKKSRLVVLTICSRFSELRRKL